MLSKSVVRKKVLSKFYDIIASNAIVLISYLSILLLSNLNFLNEKYVIYIYFPFGVIVLGYVFFGNKVIFALILGHIIYYFISIRFNLNLNFNNYFIISMFHIICVPKTMFILKKLNFEIGVGNSYKLDKTNIKHMLLITLYSSISFLILILCYSFFNELNYKVLFYFISNFIGGALLLITLKLIFTIISYFKII